MPKISVIVPVYKVEQYLDRCVKSILDQTFADFEMILVDDGSPDNCGAMCDAWAEKDSRIKVIHKENGGLSDARNAGFAVAESEWITFIDSDDYVHPAMLEVLYTAAVQTGTGISTCGFVSVSQEKIWESVPADCVRYCTPEEYYTADSNTATSACGKLYHKTCFTGVRFPEGKLHEDAFTTYRLLFACQYVAVAEAALYAYFVNPGSITKSDWNWRRLDLLEAIEQQIDYFTQKGMTGMRRFMIREYIKCILWQQDAAATAQDAMEREAGGKILDQKGRTALRRYWNDRVITGEADMWIYKRFYPRLTGCYLLFRAALRKLGWRK